MYYLEEDESCNRDSTKQYFERGQSLDPKLGEVGGEFDILLSQGQGLVSYVLCFLMVLVEMV